MSKASVAKAVKNPHSEKEYVDTFIKHFGCKREEFEIRQRYEGGGYMAMYDGSLYAISNYRDVRREICEMIQAEPYNLNGSFILMVAEEIHLDEKYCLQLMKELTKEEFLQFDFALGLSLKLDGSASVFWNALQRIDEIDLYGKCAAAIFSVYNREDCIDEFTDYTIAYGKNHLTEMQGGIFETIEMSEIDSNESFFYIYDIDSINWDI